MPFELDPLYWQIARWLLATVFAVALAHKLRSLPAFAAIVRDYELLPPGMVPPAVGLVVVLEAVVVAALVGSIGVPWGAMLAAALLAIYGAAMAINLARGRRDIDCGCFGPAGGAGRHTLSRWLLVRNSVLMLVAAFLFVPATGRELGWLDLGSIAMATAAGFALLSAADQLIANAPRLRGVAR
jgi:hypothetical protein